MVIMILKSPCPKNAFIIKLLGVINDAFYPQYREKFCQVNISKMSKNSQTQTENTGLYDPLLKINAMIQNCDVEKCCHSERVCPEILKNYKTITPLFWAEQPRSRKYKTGKFTQTPRNFLFSDKFTQTLHSDFSNKKSKIINFSGKSSIQKRKREDGSVDTSCFSNKKICSAFPPVILKMPELSTCQYKPTPIFELEKAKIQRQIEKVESELQKLQFDVEVNKFALGEVKKDTDVAESKIQKMCEFAESISNGTKCVEKLRNKFEELDLSVFEMEVENSVLGIVELDEESIKSFWPGDL